MLAGEDHVVLAVGRDYADVAPVSGVVLASSHQRLVVQVDVSPSETRTDFARLHKAFCSAATK